MEDKIEEQIAKCIPTAVHGDDGEHPAFGLFLKPWYSSGSQPSPRTGRCHGAARVPPPLVPCCWL